MIIKVHKNYVVRKINSGIYKITIGNDTYVGSTMYLTLRKNNHLSALRLNKHINKGLQLAFNKLGETNFVFDIIELTPVDLLSKREMEIQLELKPSLNPNICKGGSHNNRKHTYIISNKSKKNKLVVPSAVKLIAKETGLTKEEILTA